MTFAKEDQSDHELTLKGKIKNLQVSNSIFRKKMEDNNFKLEHLDEEGNEELFEKLRNRNNVLTRNIWKKEEELVPLKEEAAKIRENAKLEKAAIKAAEKAGNLPKTAEEHLK